MRCGTQSSRSVQEHQAAWLMAGSCAYGGGSCILDGVQPDFGKNASSQYGPQCLLVPRGGALDGTPPGGAMPPSAGAMLPPRGMMPPVGGAGMMPPPMGMMPPPPMGGMMPSPMGMGMMPPPMGVNMMPPGMMPPPMGMMPPPMGMMPPPMEEERPFTMQVSPLFAVVPADFKTQDLGRAAMEFNKPLVQCQFSTMTVETVFRPLMGTMLRMRVDWERVCGRTISDAEWISFFTSTASRDTNRITNMVSRLYSSAATGDIHYINAYLLELAAEGYVIGAETRMAVPDRGREVDFIQLIGLTVARAMQLSNTLNIGSGPALSNQQLEDRAYAL